ncbi:sulfite exporter TauE/SafE family protein [uncultured Tateyamaria sp.]|uniref:sulfite exporter TauE/SafE family protein n=1 Tax=uncultured Tateyamaria sp. TaxID=455651 RepID=UPI002629C69D|nr:sulfite exporter TauE/SafE family protein [uncultured Tateyamaria sp.]
MSAEFIFYLVLGAVAGGFINGLSGTGTALFALGFYLVVLYPVQAVAIVALMSVLAGLQGLWIVRAEIWAQPARLLRFLVPGLIGVPVGVSLLSVIDAGLLRIAIASLLIIYGGYFSFRAALPAFSRRTPWIDSGIGFVGGLFGGAASVSGAIPAMWLSIRPWTKAETRAVLQPFNVAILSTTVCLLFVQGAYDRTAINALMITIPCGLVAAQVGIMVFRRLSDIGFRRLLIALTLLMGLGVMASELF